MSENLADLAVSQNLSPFSHAASKNSNRPSSELGRLYIPLLFIKPGPKRGS
jgi:hypothetical protein